MNNRLLRWLLMAIPTVVLALPTSALTMTVEQFVSIALQSNPGVRSARARWNAAEHSVDQNYAPADPIFTYGSSDSPTNGFDYASAHELQASASFQFPGKGYLQAKSAERTAQIARLAYEAAVRDVRARTEVQYYQRAIDASLVKHVSQTIENLLRIQSIITADGAPEYSAAISSDLADATRRRRRFEIACADDETRLNELLNRRPDEPLNVEPTVDLQPLPGRVDEFIEQAWSTRQEILKAALQEQNAETALTLAKLEYAPDYTIAYAFNHYLLQSAAPAPNLTETHNIGISFNLPLFFWAKQNEDIKRAGFDLEAARADLNGMRNQTAGEVTILFRDVEFDYENAIAYRDEVVPEALKAFNEAIASYHNQKGQFATLTHLRNQLHAARASYIEAVNSFIAGRIALEQEIGEPLGK